MKKARIVVGVILLIYWLIQTYRFSEIELSDRKVTKCGTVTFKGNHTQVNKHSSDIEFILVVQYDDNNRKTDEEVSASIWSSYNVGDRICLSWDDNPVHIMGMINGLFGMVGMIVFGFGSVIVGVMLLVWFFTGTNPFKSESYNSTL
jgi:hypothetical protein